MFPRFPPLKIRGAGGVMTTAEITLFIALTLRGELKRRGGFGIGAFGLCLSFELCNLGFSGPFPPKVLSAVRDFPFSSD